MIDVLKKWSGNPIPYGQSQGELKFLESLVYYYNKLGFNFIHTANIQVITGGSEAISMAFFATCETGDEVIVFEPFYTNYNSYAAVNQIKLIPVRTYGENGFHLPDKKEIEKKSAKKPRQF